MVRDAHGPADALAWFEAALEIDPGNPDIHAEYAATLGELGRYTDMLHAVRTLARVAPDHPQVHYLQAVLAARAQDPVLARTLLSQSGLAEAGVPAAMLLDALIHMQQGTHDTAADILETLAARQPANNRIAELLAKAWWMGGRDRAVVERFEEVARDDAASPYLAMLVGRSLERLGERDRAIPFIERARRRAGVGPISLPSSEDMPAMTRDLRYRLALGDGAAGAAILGEFPQSADAHMLAGDAAFIEGDTLRAIDLYQTAAQVRRPWALTRKLVAAYRAAGADRAADALLLRHAAAEPQNGDALIMLARRSLLAEDWLRADLLLSRAAQLGIGTDPAILDLRAQAARGLGYDEAARQFDQARMHLAPRLLAPL
jgi:Tfp pilus assembly protein PilF